MNVDEFKEFITYDPDTGLMYWNKVINNKARSGDLCGSNVDSKGYRRVCFKGKQFRAHRVAWLLYYGCTPSAQIDHINGNRTDNRICNLRLASNAENSRNAKLSKDNTSGCSGVTYHKKAKKWAASIMYNRKQIYLGIYENILDAVQVRKEAEVRYFGAFSKSTV